MFGNVGSHQWNVQETMEGNVQARGQGEPQALQQTLLIMFDRYASTDPEGQGGRPRRTQLRYWMPECSRALRLAACPPRTLQQRRPRERHTSGSLRSGREECGYQA